MMNGGRLGLLEKMIDRGLVGHGEDEEKWSETLRLKEIRVL